MRACGRNVVITGPNVVINVVIRGKIREPLIGSRKGFAILFPSGLSRIGAWLKGASLEFSS